MKTRIQTPETKEKISNSQRLRFARYKRALKESELGKLEQIEATEEDSLDENEKLLELRFQVQDVFQVLVDALFSLFKFQLRMNQKELKFIEIMDKVDINSIVDKTFKDYLNKNIVKDGND